MNIKGIQSAVAKTILVLSVVFGFVLLTSTAAQAQYRDDRGYGRNGGYYGNDIYQIAEQNGYNDGLRKGAEDAREGHNNPTGTSEYKHATDGYNSRYGNKNDYKQAYRQGFLDGFNEAQSRYYNNGRYPNNNRYPNNYPRNRRNNNGTNILRRIILGY